MGGMREFVNDHCWRSWVHIRRADTWPQSTVGDAWKQLALPALKNAAQRPGLTVLQLSAIALVNALIVMVLAIARYFDALVVE